jgi:hypothetical protein
MGKIEPEHVNAAFHQFQKFFVRIAGRPYGGYNFCAVMGVLNSGGFIHLTMEIFIYVF